VILRIDDVQRVVAQFYGLTAGDMRSENRSYKIAHPRQVAMMLAYEMTDKSHPEIGRAFGGRDHTTSIHALRAVTGRMAKLPKLVREVDAIRQQISMLHAKPFEIEACRSVAAFCRGIFVLEHNAASMIGLFALALQRAEDRRKVVLMWGARR
jgi:hypothetical protein